MKRQTELTLALFNNLEMFDLPENCEGLDSFLSSLLTSLDSMYDTSDHTQNVWKSRMFAKNMHIYCFHLITAKHKNIHLYNTATCIS